MQQITGISDLPAQIVNVTASDGSVVTLTLAYRPQQYGWFMDLLWNGSTPAAAINAIRITNFPNMLRQWRNLLSFGLGCVTADGQEPITATAFSSGYARMLLLDPSDVAQIEAEVFPGN